MYTMDYPKFIVSNQKEESINSILRVNFSLSENSCFSPLQKYKKKKSWLKALQIYISYPNNLERRILQK